MPIFSSPVSHFRHFPFPFPIFLFLVPGFTSSPTGVVPETDEVETVLPVDKDKVEDSVKEGTPPVTLSSGDEGPVKEVN